MSALTLTDLAPIPVGVLILGKEGRVVPGGFSVSARKMCGLDSLDGLSVQQLLFEESKVPLTGPEQEALLELCKCIGDPVMVGEVFASQLPKVGAVGAEAQRQLVHFAFIEEMELIERIIVTFTPLPKGLGAPDAASSSDGSGSTLTLPPSLLPQSPDERADVEVFIRLRRCDPPILEAAVAEIQDFSQKLGQLASSLSGSALNLEVLDQFSLAFRTIKGTSSQIGLDAVTDAASQGDSFTKELKSSGAVDPESVTKLAAHALSVVRAWMGVEKIRKGF